MENYLASYEKILVSVKMYCEVCEKAAALGEEYLSRAYKDYLGAEQRRSDRGNYRNLAAFLCKPNIIYPLTERVDQKRGEAMVDAGKRIVGAIAYAWDYYFRVLKGKLEQSKGQSKSEKEAGLYEEKNVRLALKRIGDMLRELAANKYHWENYTKEGLANLSQEKKELEEEETFVKLLQNLLQAQIQNIRRKRGTQPDPSEERLPLERPEEDFGLSEDYAEKPAVGEALRLGDYFRRKLAQREGGQPVDPIAQCQQQRRFNALALQHYLTTQAQ